MGFNGHSVSCYVIYYTYLRKSPEAWLRDHIYHQYCSMAGFYGINQYLIWPMGFRGSCISYVIVRYYNVYSDGLGQERHNSIANALQLCLSCTNPSLWSSAPECCYTFAGLHNFKFHLTKLFQSLLAISLKIWRSCHKHKSISQRE